MKGKPPRYSTVFWDWNGTLLNDLDHCIAVRNRVFPRYGLPCIESVRQYHDQFTFPVRLYYERAGVTEETFVEVANAWMEEYMRGCHAIPLHTGARVALEQLAGAGVKQVVLSASDQAILREQLAQYELESYFADVLGLSHIYATGKQSIGQAYLRAANLPLHQCILLGDTLHDAQTADAMGVDCLLIAQGHQSRQSLVSAGKPVVNCLAEAVNLVLDCM